jgi:hypothetical protein
MERKTNADSNMKISMGESNFSKNRLISQAVDQSSPVTNGISE